MFNNKLLFSLLCWFLFIHLFLDSIFALVVRGEGKNEDVNKNQ